MGLVYVGKIVQVEPIENADRIVLATVVCGPGGKWKGIVQKDQFKVDDLCNVYLQDSLLPHTEQFAFTEKWNYRIRMQRLRGVPSECLIMPSSMEIYGWIGLPVGTDITEITGVTKYEKPIAAQLQGIVKGDFPSFIPKTDEPNFQTVPHIREALVGKSYYITTKCDGASATIYKYRGEFGCCSRNLELKRDENNAIWKIAKQYDLENLLPDRMAIQFEIVGPGIQKNPMGLTQIEPRLFNVYNIEFEDYRGHYYGFNGMISLADSLNFPTVPIVKWPSGPWVDPGDEMLRLMAEGKFGNGKEREGIVIRSEIEERVMGDRISFKVINLRYIY
jgi:RNA ligase (TIGR02306 family)